MTEFQTLLCAMVIFVGGHFLMSHPLREPMTKAFGEKGFMGVYSLVSLGSLIWAIFAFRAVPQGEMWWAAPAWFWTVISIDMWIACILLAGSYFGNPAMPSPKAAEAASVQPKGVFAITRHPMMWSFMIWAACHLALVPDPRSAVMTGGIFILAFFGSRGQDSKKDKTMGASWTAWKAKTSFWPFARQIKNGNWGEIVPSIGVIALGTAIWLGATWLHTPAGAPTVGIWNMF